MSNYWYFSVDDQDSESDDFTEVETGEIYEIKRRIEAGEKVLNIEDDCGFATHVYTWNTDVTDVDILIEFDEANDHKKGQMWAKYVLGANHCDVEDINIFVGDLHTYAQQVIADRLGMDFDDVFILLYVNIERFARDMMVNDRIEEFRIDGKDYLYIPS